MAPSYEQKHFAKSGRRNRLRLLGSRDGRNDSITIHQDVDFYAALLSEGEAVTHSLGENRKAWIQLARGSLQLSDQQLRAGDGLAISNQPELTLRANSEAEMLLFDMA